MAKLSSIGEAVPSGGRAVFTAYNKKIADDIGAKLAAPPRRDFTPSAYQQAIFDWVIDPSCISPEGCTPLPGAKEYRNAVVEAVAGSGKTTTMVQVCRLLNMQVNSATFHSIGLRAWQTVARPQVRGEKVEDIMEEMEIDRALRAVVGKLVSLAKQRGIGIDGPSLAFDAGWEDIIEHFDLEEMIPAYVQVGQVISLAREVLAESVRQAAEVIDFEDMIYMPLQAGIAIPQYDWVIVDELQDTNPTRRELARRMIGPNGRFIGVGDPHQAIYGFTGADNDAMDLVVEQFDCIRLPLTVSYRCPKAVVRHAQRWVSHIEAAPSAKEGVTRTISLKDFNGVLGAFASGRGLSLASSLSTNDAILCRNTRPLIETAFDMIRRRIPCHVEGRDIGQGLISLVKKWKSVRTVAQLRERLEEHLETETTKLLWRGRRDKVASLEDKIGTLFVFMGSLADDESTSILIKDINALFKDTETGKKAATVTLSTVHKSKGREWPRVYLLGRNTLMPSPYAKQAWQLEQENNLCYVAVTRAMEELIEVEFPMPGGEEETFAAMPWDKLDGEDALRDGHNWPDIEAVEKLPGFPKDDVAKPRLAEPPFDIHKETAKAIFQTDNPTAGERDKGRAVNRAALFGQPYTELSERVREMVNSHTEQFETNKAEAVRQMEEFLRRHSPSPSERPTMTDLMVPPEAIPDHNEPSMEDDIHGMEQDYLRLMDDMRANGYHEGSD